MNYGFFIYNNNKQQMKNTIIISDEFQLVHKVPRIHILLKYHKRSKDRFGIIKIIQNSLTHKIHFFPSNEMFKLNKDFKVQIRNGFINFDMDKFKVKGFDFGYFLEQQYIPIQSMHDIDPLGQGNIIKHQRQNKYIIVLGNKLSLSTLQTSHQLLFYRVIENKLRFYLGFQNYEDQNQIYIKIESNKLQISYDKGEAIEWIYNVLGINSIYIVNQQNYWSYSEQFYVNKLFGDQFNYQQYQHKIISLQYDFFGLDDHTFLVFTTNNRQVIYQQSDNLLQIQIGPYNEAKFYVNRIQYYLKLTGSSIYLVQQKSMFYIQEYQNNLFSLNHQNKYLAYINGAWSLMYEPFKFKNKPHGFYIFHVTGIDKCLSSYNLSIIEDRYVDPQYALYFSIQNSLFYLNKREIYMNEQDQLTYTSGYHLKLFQIPQGFGFLIGFQFNENKRYLRLIQKGQFKFTEIQYQATTFFYSNTKYWDFTAYNSIEIQLKKIDFNNNKLQLIENEQKYKTKWLLIENQFLLLPTGQLLYDLFPLKFSEAKLYSEMIPNPYSIRLKNIKKIYPNYFSANLVAHANNFYNNLSNQLIIGSSGNYLSSSNQTIDIYFHKIPSVSFLPQKFGSFNIQILNQVLSKNYEFTKNVVFRKIGNNLYKIQDSDFILTLLEANPLNPLKIMKYSNIFNNNITFTLLKYDGRRCNILCKLWGNYGCEGIINQYNDLSMSFTLGNKQYDFTLNLVN